MSAHRLPPDAVRLARSVNGDPSAVGAAGAVIVGEGSDFIVYGATLADHARGPGATPVVVKAPRPHTDHRRPMEALEAELLREHQALSALEHPAIPTAHGLWVLPDGRLGLVRGYLSGVTLTTLIERGLVKHRFQGARRWTPATRAIVAAIGDALAHVHRRGLVHNDLKPDNVVVRALSDGRVAVGLFDFGTAGADASGGTVHYAAPERLAGRPATARSDVFSFGVLIYELLSGTRPFPSETTADALLERQTPIARQPREAAQRAWRAFPPEVQAALTRALDPNPRRRPRSVPRLLRDLGLSGARPRRAPRSAPAAAPPPAPLSPEPTGPLQRLGPLVAATLASIVVALAVSFGGLPGGAAAGPGASDPACLAALADRAARVCDRALTHPADLAACRAALSDPRGASCEARLAQLAGCPGDQLGATDVIAPDARRRGP